MNIDEDGFPTRTLPDGRTLFVQAVLYGKGRLYIEDAAVY
jgi:hypothetical protein